MKQSIPVVIDYAELRTDIPAAAEGLLRHASIFEPVISSVLKDFAVSECGQEVRTLVENKKLVTRDFDFTIINFHLLTKLRDLSSTQIG